ncbi:GNAT family N-acetyltransferase [Peribacillus frigoritolerans]|uniref:GNAT family N-acetyltransferase n=1 Tax=Peribacillus frigoritolerans TaxID=450367 RepID=UPI00342988F3
MEFPYFLFNYQYSNLTEPINNEGTINGLEIYGAYENGDLIGVIATRSEGSPIVLFFVHGKYHRKGIGRKLFEVVLKK